jgi:uncharacterized protein (TIGR03435 family)
VPQNEIPVLTFFIGNRDVILERMRMLLAIAFAAVVFAEERPTFDVASIKLHQGIGNLVKLQALPGGRLESENVSLRYLMLFAYGVQDFQITGAPEWTRTDRYDIQAKAEGNPPGKVMAGPMLQTLLEDRFKLKLHRETKQLPVYELTVAKSGVKMRSSKEGGCVPWSLDSPPPLPLAPGEQRTFCGFRGFGVDGQNRKLEVFGITMAELVAILQRSELRRTIVDKTGLAGTFDVRMNWSLESASAADAGPAIFTALQEQLGLRLEATKGPVEVIVVDHVEKPSAN